jgi:3-dehydroquinate dehydratase/shikimate dehydrogenase
MAQICVSLSEATTVGMIDRMVDLAHVADLFELRADCVQDLDLLTILRAKTRPLLLACRPAAEGGRYPDDESRRRLILLEGVRRGFEYVDVEFRSQFVDVMVEKAGRGLVVSYHDFDGTPDDLRGLYTAMCAHGADIVKLAVTPQSVSDVARLMAFAAEVREGGGPRLLPIAMGPLGVVTRILAGRLGAPFTFASPAAGSESAPGQLPVKVMDEVYRVRRIGPQTRLYGVVGADVTGSLSPVLHNCAFAATDMDAVFVPLSVDAIAPFVEAVAALGVEGFSVTRPFKVGIVPLLGEVDEMAALAGSVNTVKVREDGFLHGISTDGRGVVGPLRRRLDLRGRRVVILGAGGAARAAALSLRARGAIVVVLARNPTQAASVASTVGCGHGPLEDLPHCTWDILINATPVGSGALRHETPVPAHLHRPGAVVFDMVYDPLETRLLHDARSAGSSVIDGMEMLLEQAAAQFSFWTGKPVPLAAMQDAAVAATRPRTF